MGVLGCEVSLMVLKGVELQKDLLVSRMLLLEFSSKAILLLLGSCKG